MTQELQAEVDHAHEVSSVHSRDLMEYQQEDKVDGKENDKVQSQLRRDQVLNLAEGIDAREQMMKTRNGKECRRTRNHGPNMNIPKHALDGSLDILAMKHDQQI